MSFPNEVYFEASTEVDGVVISVRECGQYISDISFEDAWFKANELAKTKAELKLQEALEKMKKEENLDIVQIKGCPGPRGFPGPKGSPGQDLVLIPNIIRVGLPVTPPTSKKELGVTERIVLDVTIDSKAYINVIELTGNVRSSKFRLNITYQNKSQNPLPGHLLYITVPKIDDKTTYTLGVSGNVWFNSLADNQGPGRTQNNILFMGNNKDAWVGMFSFVSNGFIYIGNSNTTNPSDTIYDELTATKIAGSSIVGGSVTTTGGPVVA